MESHSIFISIYSKAMEALKDCLKILNLLHLCKWNPSIPWGRIRIPNLLMQFIYLMPLNMNCCGMIIYCALKVDDLFTLLGIGYSLVGLVSIESIYWSLIVNNSLVEKSVIHLRQIVRQRKY